MITRTARLTLVRDGDHTVMDALLHTWATSMRASGKSEDTVRAYTGAVDRCARHASTSPDQLTPDDVAGFLVQHRNSRATQQQYFKGLAAFQKWMVRTGRGEGTLLDGLDRPPTPDHEPDPVTTGELERILAQAQTRPTRAMVLLGAYGGLRVHEIAKTCGSDFAGGQLLVVGKGNRKMRVQVHPLLADMAAAMPAVLWFPSRDDPTVPRSRRSVGATMGRVMAAAGIVGGHPHQLRAWYATELVRAGVPLTTVRVMMRHRHLSSTQHYVLVERSDCLDAVRLLPVPAPALAVAS